MARHARDTNLCVEVRRASSQTVCLRNHKNDSKTNVGSTLAQRYWLVNVTITEKWLQSMKSCIIHTIKFISRRSFKDNNDSVLHSRLDLSNANTYEHFKETKCACLHQYKSVCCAVCEEHTEWFQLTNTWWIKPKHRRLPACLLSVRAGIDILMERDSRDTDDARYGCCVLVLLRSKWCVAVRLTKRC